MFGLFLSVFGSRSNLPPVFLTPLLLGHTLFTLQPLSYWPNSLRWSALPEQIHPHPRCPSCVCVSSLSIMAWLPARRLPKPVAPISNSFSDARHVTFSAQKRCGPHDTPLWLPLFATAYKERPQPLYCVWARDLALIPFLPRQPTYNYVSARRFLMAACKWLPQSQSRAFFFFALIQSCTNCSVPPSCCSVIS